MTESIADRHRRLAADFHSTVAAVPPEAMSRATPCEGWAVTDVIDHVTNTQLDFLDQRGLAAPTDASLLRSRPLAVTAAMQAALDDPATADATFDGYFGPTTIAETVDAFYCLDLVLHRWDIAVAAGLDDDATISNDDIERCRALMAPMGDNIRMPGIFGPEVEAGPSPTPTASFVAWAGRTPQ